jgi:ribosomal protein S6--L-glutamate ligase
MSVLSILCLGAGDGWHSRQLEQAADAFDCRLSFAEYESLCSKVGKNRCQAICEAGPIRDFDVILTRTMPAGSLEQITFRLAILHQLALENQVALVNPPRALEIAIDKFATLAHVAELGYQVPETVVVQSRDDAMDAFRALGSDCVVKPVFGGEGRGVMRIRDDELAWYTFSTLDQLNAVIYVQEFVAPGGRDARLLVIGESVLGVRRRNDHDFRTNVGSGAKAEAFQPTSDQRDVATRIVRSIGLRFASVDLIDTEDGEQQVLEVNAIPGWKAAQSVVSGNIAQQIVQLLVTEASLSGVQC